MGTFLRGQCITYICDDLLTLKVYMELSSIFFGSLLFDTLNEHLDCSNTKTWRLLISWRLLLLFFFVTSKTEWHHFYAKKYLSQDIIWHSIILENLDLYVQVLWSFDHLALLILSLFAWTKNQWHWSWTEPCMIKGTRTKKMNTFYLEHTILKVIRSHRQF